MEAFRLVQSIATLAIAAAAGVAANPAQAVQFVGSFMITEVVGAPCHNDDPTGLRATARLMPSIRGSDYTGGARLTLFNNDNQARGFRLGSGNFTGAFRQV